MKNYELVHVRSNSIITKLAQTILNIHRIIKLTLSIKDIISNSNGFKSLDVSGAIFTGNKTTI